MPNKSDKTTGEDLKFDLSRVLSIWSFIAVGFFIGVPLWWKTTETYRVSLPYDKIEDLAEKKLKIKIDVQVILEEDDFYKLENVKLFGRKLKTRLNENEMLVFSDVHNVTDEYKVNLRVLSVEEEKFMQKSPINDFVDNFGQEESFTTTGKINIYVLSSKSTIFRTEKSFFVTKNRLIFYKSVSDLDKDVDEISRVVFETVVNRKGLQTAMANVMDPHLTQPDKKTMRTLQSSPVYDVTFTLIVPQPQFVRAKWNIENAIEVYFQPMLDKLSDLVKFNVKSQVLYLTSLNVEPKYNEDGRHFYLVDTQLPHVLNPIEAKLGSYISTNPNVNFVVYIPTKEQSPLYIYDSFGNISKTNAFLSPRWGGIFIDNFVDDKNEIERKIPFQFDVDSAKMMSVFLTQIRLLLGLDSLELKRNIDFESFDESLITDLEYDYLLRKTTLENVAKVSNTLRSLSELLEQIDNIVINDEVGDSVFAAVDATFESISHLENGDLLQAFLYSSDGYVASEKAFFDPTMLALLYFPKDQKYAVYTPLFLPVCVPIVFSIFYLLKTYKTQQQHEKID